MGAGTWIRTFVTNSFWLNFLKICSLLIKLNPMEISTLARKQRMFLQFCGKWSFHYGCHFRTAGNLNLL